MISGVSIIIPVFNKVELTRQFFDSFSKTLPSGPFEVIIVNNASSDETAAFCTEFAAQNSWMTLLSRDTNDGYGPACNAGSLVAKHSHLLFMNNDMLVFPGFLEPLANAFEDERIGIAGSRLIYPDMTIQHAGIIFPEDRIPVHAHRKQHYTIDAVSAPRCYAAVTGACLMIPKSLFVKAGGFDSAYTMYFEDIDLCLKIHEMKLLTLYVPQSMLIHLEGKSSGSFNEMAQKSLKSMPVFLQKWGAYLTRALREDFELFRNGKTYPPGQLVSQEPFEQVFLKELITRIQSYKKNNVRILAYDLLLKNHKLFKDHALDPAVIAVLSDLDSTSSPAINRPDSPCSWQKAKETITGPDRVIVKRNNPLRILVQNRPNAFSQPGGDTVLMNRLKEQLERHGALVDFSSELFFEKTASYDLVHIFNLTAPEQSDAFAKNAVLHNIPFVVTALQENFPLYYHKATAALDWFREYVTADVPVRKTMALLKSELASVSPVPLFTARFAARAANMVFASGETEAALLHSIFPAAKLSVVPFGSTITDRQIEASLFEKAFDMRDFVLCVGRLESRKNQLMLLHALEDSDVPVVFVDGGFTYSPEYSALCKIYKRKGATLFTGRLSDEMLVSAFRACRLHCLPSWYELPGLVSIEAAQYGKPIVASSWGTLPDYMGSACAYCQPDDPESIRNAVLKVYADKSAAMQSRLFMNAAQHFSWEKFGNMTMHHYDRVIQEHSGFSEELITEAKTSLSATHIAPFMSRIAQLVEEGKFQEALTLYDGRTKSPGEDNHDLARIDAIMTKLRSKLKPQQRGFHS